MAFKKRYYRGQGKVFYAERNAISGIQTGGFNWVGNVTTLEMTLDVQSVEHYESHTGQSLEDLMFETTKKAMFALTMEDYNASVLSRFTYGTQTDVDGATVTGEDIVGYLGKYSTLANINITTFTSLTNAAGAITYNNGDDYTIDLRTGTIYIVPTGDITDGQALKATYAFADTQKVAVLTTPNTPVILRIDGLNTTEGDSPVVIDVPKFRFKPVDKLPLIGNEVSSYQVNGDALYDDTQPDTTEDGRFFRIRQLSNAA